MTEQKEQMTIELVTKVKQNGEVETKTYKMPSFIPFSKLVNATESFDGIDNKSEFETMKIMGDLISELYNKQFTPEQFMDGVDIREIGEVVEKQMTFLTSAFADEADKQEQKENLKEVTK
ncbi:phage tail assembly chaperone G [Staphylococcus shinii]|uniref:phage tail assembly chaperone G n=1 Tax=Staphylococcus shinii TaxID=2912228 RepID=UPI003F546437